MLPREKIRPVQYTRYNKYVARVFVLSALVVPVLFSGPATPAMAEIKIMEGDSYVLETTPYERTDLIMLENTVDLDTKIRDDRVQYIGIDYALALDLKFKNDGPQIYFKLERYGPYAYDAPAIIHNTLNTYTGKVSAYHGAELLPKAEEFWMDVPLSYKMPLRVKGGLYAYTVGHGISLNGFYKNYGLEAYTESDTFTWRVYTCWPDYSNKQLLGPYIKQEKPQLIDYEHSKAYFVSTDVKISTEKMAVQPYVGLLMDFSDGKRSNLFQTPTREDMLGTVGVSWDFKFDKLSFGVEWARNFGVANSSDPEFPDVVHTGYTVFADASYAIGDFVPHSYFSYASGNKVTEEMVANGDVRYPGSTNNAFSVYSPFNTYLADAIYPSMTTMPLVATGNGYGISYGVRRAGTFGDPGCMDNLVFIGIGFDYAFIKQASLVFDWWYMSNVQQGIGVYNGIPKKISPDLGHEVDLAFNYTVNKNIKLKASSGIFFPGAAYREERTDTGGSLFTQFVRGDGKADPAYQLEMSVEFGF